ncbi:NAD(P)-dependent oxidoreductase [Pelistega europaea]|uniref:D-2-hydroxyacid dehydrogenase n=1 Tax=Pelistega europaea TaxID=106147 RepID=A0A7Y4P592_9BURK|nr:NAD(P)-dependent oxidoreductase [Pelistega europaea]NOL48525.1 D-2-hydroxyacid dehydrogenase [Pelistega europaea]
MHTLNITCAQKSVLLPLRFNFDFPTNYTEFDNLTQEEFEQKVHNQDVLIISSLIVNEKVLNNNPHLKLLALSSTGYNHVDIPLLQSRGVKVCNIHHYAGDAVAEHAFMLMINLARQFNVLHKNVISKDWSRSQKVCFFTAPMYELQGKTLTIIGKGEIGQSLAKKAQAFGMKVIFSARKGETCQEGFVPFETSIRQADFLSLHCDLNPSTQKIINAEVLSWMKPTSILVNVSRGGLIDEEALIEALKKEKLFGFGADVLSEEPPSENHPLLQLNHPNLIITSHIAWATEEAKKRLFAILESNINNNLKGIDQNRIC